MARTAIISDIHGNYSGLLAALKDAKLIGCDRIICLGDLVDGGMSNEEVVRELQSQEIPCVRGNHDEFNSLSLGAETDKYLKSLPETVVEEDILYIHISPRVKKRKIATPEEAWNVFDESKYRIVFFGHLHAPVIFGEKCETSCSATVHQFQYNKPFLMDVKDRYLICPGAIGYSRDALPNIRYAVFDDAASTVEIRCVDGETLNLGHWYRD